MSKKRKISRTRDKISALPSEIREEIDEMLLNTDNTFIDISRYLLGKGHKISKSSIGRYALKTQALTQRLLETREQMKEVIEIAKESKDNEHLTEAGLQIVAGKLTEKLAFMQEEIEDMDAETAIKIQLQLARVLALQEKTFAESEKRKRKFIETLEKQFDMELKEKYPDIAEKIKTIVRKEGEKLIEEDK